MLNSTEISLIIVVLLIIFAALLSCFETSITAASRAKIYRLKNEGDKRAKKLEKLLQNREKVVSVMLLANNTVSIVASALTTKVLLEMFGEIGVVYGTIVLTILVIVCGEILPKTIAIQSPEKSALTFVSTIDFLFRFFGPIVEVIQKIVDWMIGLFRIRVTSKSSKGSELEEIRETLDLKAKEGSIFKYDKDLLDGVLDLSDTAISEIVVHRKDIQSINIELPIKKIVKQAIETSYTRVPLWQGNKENIVAILNVRKLLKALHFYKSDIEKFDLSCAISKPWYVPASNSLRSQLVAFRKNKKRFALVIDEYGSLQGLITLEDILEEIVGEIKEQDDGLEINVVKIKSGAYKISGKTMIRDINKKLEWNIEETNDAYNLSTFIINQLGRIPEEKENFIIHDFYFEILKRREQDLIMIKVKKLAIS